MEHGYWIANCKSNLSLPGSALANSQKWADQKWVEPLSVPAPDRIDQLRRNEIALHYADGPSEPIALRLRVLRGFRPDPPGERRGKQMTVQRGDLSTDTLTVTADYAGPRAGVATSAGALAARLLYLAFVRTRPRAGA